MNVKYNGFDFIKNNMPKEPLLRFKGSTIDEYNSWAYETKAKLKEILGISNLAKVKLNAKLLETKEFENYRRLKYEINTIENLYMPFYVLEPINNPNGKAVAAIHGHGSDGKEGLVGCEAESYKQSVEKYSYRYGFQLLEKGYTVFIPDLLGAGERTLGVYKNNTAECNDINNALLSLGMSLQGIILFENLRLVEFIVEQGFNEIQCCGFSGGGHSALWLTVMEDRISSTIISGFLHSFKDTLIYQNRCGCNFIPKQWEYVDMGDILALAAGKDIYIETGNEDKLNGERGITGVFEQIEIADRCFMLFNKKVNVNICNGGHKWYGSWL